jgi:membrane protease YdiL (CAAX protease family)
MKFLSPTQQAGLRWVFIGSDGIRAGWSVLIFAFVIGFFGFAVQMFFVHVLHHVPKKPTGEIAPAFLLIRDAIFLAVTLVATAVMGLIEGKSVWSYGLQGPRVVAKFVSGWVGGLVCLSLLVVALNASGYLVFDGRALHGVSIVGYGFVWLLAFLLVGLSEETLFRGYVQATLTRGMGFWPAALVISLSFGAAHLGNPGESVAGIAGVVAAGLIFCLLLWVSGSLWLGIGFHTAWDWAQSYFYGTPDSGLMMRGHLLVTHAVGDARMSGGSAGPEGSILGAPVLICGLLAMVFLLRWLGMFAAPAVAAE